MGMMDKAKNFLSSGSGKQKAGQFLDKAEQMATDKLGADKAGKISRARDTIEDRLGGRGTPQQGPGPDSDAHRTPNSMERPEEPGIDDGRGTDTPGAAGGEGNPRP